jgi:hypothetical protein
MSGVEALFVRNETTAGWYEREKRSMEGGESGVAGM